MTSSRTPSAATPTTAICSLQGIAVLGRLDMDMQTGTHGRPTIRKQLKDGSCAAAAPQHHHHTTTTTITTTTTNTITTTTILVELSTITTTTTNTITTTTILVGRQQRQRKELCR